MTYKNFPRNEWLEHMIWCPSQITYYFDDPLDGKTWVVYLRWRYRDPWEYSLYEVLDEEKDLEWGGEWGEKVKEFVLPRDFKDNEWKELEEACIEKLKELFPHIEFDVC